MDKIEKIKRYIERTGIKDERGFYTMTTSEWIALIHMKDTCYAILLAFNLGRAKGERHARKEFKKA